MTVEDGNILFSDLLELEIDEKEEIKDKVNGFCLLMKKTTNEDSTKMIGEVLSKLKTIDKSKLCKFCFMVYRIFSLEIDESNVELWFKSFAPTPGLSYIKAESTGRKILFILLLYHVVKYDIKIKRDILTKLTYIVSRSLESSLIGLMGATIFSYAANNAFIDEYKEIYVPVLKNLMMRYASVTSSCQFHVLIYSLKKELLGYLGDVINSFYDDSSMAMFIKKIWFFQDNKIQACLDALFTSPNFPRFWSIILSEKQLVGLKFYQRNFLTYVMNQSLLGREIMLTNSEKYVEVAQMIWSTPEVWEYFVDNSSNSNCYAYSYYQNCLFDIERNKYSVSHEFYERIMQLLVEHCSSKVSLLEARVPAKSRISQVLLSHVSDSKILMAYASKLQSLITDSSRSSHNLIYIAEQLIAVFNQSLHVPNFDLQCFVLTQLSSILTLNKNIHVNDPQYASIPETVISDFIKCTSTSLINKKCTNEQYYQCLSANFQLIHYFINVDIILDTDVQGKSVFVSSQVQPLFNSMLCYLYFYFTSWDDGIEEDDYKLINTLKLIHNQSLDVDFTESRPRKRKRQISISSLCSDNGDDKDIKSEELPDVHDTNDVMACCFVDLLVKLYHENATILCSIVDCMIDQLFASNLWNMTTIRYIKDLVMSRKTQRQLIDRIEASIQSNEKYEEIVERIRQKCVRILQMCIEKCSDIEILTTSLFILHELATDKPHILFDDISKFTHGLRNKTNPLLRYPGDEWFIKTIESALTLAEMKKSSYSNDIITDMLIYLLNHIDLGKVKLGGIFVDVMDKCFNHQIYVQQSQRIILQNVLNHHLNRLWVVRDLVINYCTKSLRLMHRCKVLVMLQSLMKYGQDHEHRTKMEYFETVYRLCVELLFEENLPKFNVSYLTILLDMLLLIMKFCHKVLPDSLLQQLKSLLDADSAMNFSTFIPKIVTYNENCIFMKQLDRQVIQDSEYRIIYLLKILPNEFYESFDENHVKVQRRITNESPLSKPVITRKQQLELCIAQNNIMKIRKLNRSVRRCNHSKRMDDGENLTENYCNSPVVQSNSSVADNAIILDTPLKNVNKTECKKASINSLVDLDD